MRSPTLEQVFRLMGQLQSGEVSYSALEAFLSDPQFLIRHTISKKRFPITISGLSFLDLVPYGRYSFIDPLVHSLKFLNCDCDILGKEFVVYSHDSGTDFSTHEILLEMKRKGFTPARAHELLAFAALYPDEQVILCIVALDEMALRHNEKPVVFCLDCPGQGRSLQVLDYDRIWHHSEHIVFLVRKIEKEV